MRITFWGTRGSLPVALTNADIRRKLLRALQSAVASGLDTPEGMLKHIESNLDFAVAGTYGGNSPCVEIDAGTDLFYVCDMGSGARAFGNRVMARTQSGKPPVVNIFMSHVHWDHIMGFPFFLPAYTPGARLRIHGCHDVLEHAFRTQQSPPFFPVDYRSLEATIEYVPLILNKPQRVGDLIVTPRLQRHTGDSYGYRFEQAGRTVIYSTDSEHKLENVAETKAIAHFFRNADLIIFDAMYSLLDAVSVREDWGHSSNIMGVELAQMAHAKHLCMFHHEPSFSDEDIEAVLSQTIRFEQLTRDGHEVKISAAYDGLELEV
jgi:phosphoribosyl 1,2-cyclic phosphodiesterase